MQVMNCKTIDYEGDTRLVPSLQDDHNGLGANILAHCMWNFWIALLFEKVQS